MRAIRHMPRASASVATIGNPSGIAATASAMADSTIRKASLPCSSPIPPMSAVRASVSQTSCPDSNASFFSSGDASLSASATNLEMWPSSVSMPVATTTPAPLPRVMLVPLKSIDVRSATRASASTGTIDLPTRIDSPVSVDSSASRSALSTTRRSAEMTSPASSRTMSPGTSRSAGIRRVRPPRSTLADRLPSALMASIDRTALISVTKPIAALRIRTPTIAPPSSHSRK